MTYLQAYSIIGNDLPLEEKEYPYRSPYLWVLIQCKKIQNPQAIISIINTIQEWLSECVTKDGIPNYRWSRDTLTTRMQDSILGEVIFANILRFKYKEDLLAFIIKFGMNEY